MSIRKPIEARLSRFLRWFKFLALITAITLCLSRLPNVAAQGSDGILSSSVLATPSSISSPTTTTAVQDATSSPIVILDSVSIRSTINVDSKVGAFFNFTIPASVFTNDVVATIWASLSLCSGPAIPSYDNITKLRSLESQNNASQILKSLGTSTSRIHSATRVGLYISDKVNQPGPNDLHQLKADWYGFATGGLVTLQLDVQQKSPGSSETIFLGVWPPRDTRDITIGTYQFQIGVSSKAKLESLNLSHQPFLDDTDSTHALVTSFNYSSSSLNLSSFVLPTTGSYSLADLDYFNSSFCAISNAWSNFQSSEFAVNINTNQTKRYTDPNIVNDTRSQFQISGLQKATNYTVWMYESHPIDNDPNLGYSFTLFPAIKMLTKSNDNCRLVYDVAFCPNVAYSIPINPLVSTSDALAVIEQTVAPNSANFSATIDTFPCGDEHFGTYSYVQTCSSCKQFYQTWLCAVTMPRCTDPVQDPATQSRASQNGSDLTGAPTGLNTHLLPYIVNRNVQGQNPSRQLYIDNELQAGTYGELLPCIYTCYFVDRACPPFVSWTCPGWDITAQRDYGAFADSNDKGFSGQANGGAGQNHLRWGGPQSYIATDAFGHSYCNPLGVDLILRQSNSASAQSTCPTTLALFITFSIFQVLSLP